MLKTPIINNIQDIAEKHKIFNPHHLQNPTQIQNFVYSQLVIINCITKKIIKKCELLI